ncbi:MAG: S1C family serine protease [Bacillota bacterium]
MTKFQGGPGRKYLLIFLLLLGFVFTSAGSTVQVYAKPDPVGSTTIADIVEASSPKVVWITTTYDRQEFQNQDFFFSQPKAAPSQGLGSGFFFKEGGYILTNAHVVAGAKSIEVTLKDEKTPLSAKLIGIDQELDIAVIKIDSSNKLTPLKLGNSETARVGDWVIAIGNPYGLDHTVTVGIISAKGRPVMAGKDAGAYQSYENMIQTDAAINPGNSGGPLLNMAGEVIGINSLVSATGQGLGFAIPINSVQEVLNELISKGKISRPWLGVNIIDIKALDSGTRSYLGLTKSEGVLIVPLKNTPASKANLRPYDLVLEINHKPIANSDDFVKLIRQQKPGDKITLLIFRNGTLVSAEVVLGEKP